MELKKTVANKTAIVHCFEFSAENPRTFAIPACRQAGSVYGGKNPADFFRNETIAETVSIHLKKVGLT
ncbi:MAG: hypothetical protein KDC94_06010 [Aequorivita sp.]|nr:hypothetical protein [Aequorivita sp.]